MPGYDGRIDRLAYVAGWACIAAFIGALWVLPRGPVVIYLVLILPLSLFAMSLTVRRLHDVGWSGYWVLLHMIPYVEVVQILLLMAIPGQTAKNRYGAPRSDQAARFGFLRTNA